MTHKYFCILFHDDPNLGVGHEDQDGDLFHAPYLGEITDWHRPEFELRDGGYPDYLANSWGLRLCSEGLRLLLAKNASDLDIIQWLEASVVSDNERRAYFALHFPFPPDVLDKHKTIFAGGDFVVKPVLSLSLIGDHKVFCYPKNEGLSLFVRDDVKREIRKAGFTGMEFSQVPVV